MNMQLVYKNFIWKYSVIGGKLPENLGGKKVFLLVL